jgi:peptidylprolyl isomerase
MLRRRDVLAALTASLALSASPGLAASPDAHTVYIDTKDGRIVIELRPDLAPKHVKQIETLTRQGFYNGVPFHRVIAGFMAQTGDPTGTGTGHSDLPDIPAEFTKTPFKRGTLGMARANEPNSANSQFFICLADADFLDGKYTIFGEVVSGMDVVDKIKKGAEADNGQVEGPDKIVKMSMAK